MNKNIKFDVATPEAGLLRMAISGPSGSGRTFSAILFAEGFTQAMRSANPAKKGEKLPENAGAIGLIDTNRGASREFGDKVPFSVAVPAETKIESVTEAILGAAGLFDLLIIDDISVPWRGLIEEMDLLTRVKHSGNSRAAWREGGPKVRQLLDAIHSFPGHVIATMRADTEWTRNPWPTSGDGTEFPSLVGLRPDQTRGIEHEFNPFVALNGSHEAFFLKGHYGHLQDHSADRLDSALGEALYNGGNFKVYPHLEANQSEDVDFEEAA